MRKFLELNFQESTSQRFTDLAMGVFFLANFVMLVLAYGVSLPSGLFMPLLLLGSAMGGLIGKRRKQACRFCCSSCLFVCYVLLLFVYCFLTYNFGRNLSVLFCFFFYICKIMLNPFLFSFLSIQERQSRSWVWQREFSSSSTYSPDSML